jgi:hypothetical protein
MDEFMIRAQAIEVRMAELTDEARAAAARLDLTALEAKDEESRFLLAQMRQLRLEQLASLLPQPAQPRRRRWWRRQAGGKRDRAAR